MGYAGICGATNVAEKSDPYFHAINLQHMSGFIHTQVSHVVSTFVILCSKNSTEYLIELENDLEH
jgi:hypothetical protein